MLLYGGIEKWDTHLQKTDIRISLKIDFSESAETVA